MTNLLTALLPGREGLSERKTMQTVQIGYGKFNLSKRSMTLSVFVVEDGFKRTLASLRLGKKGRTQVLPVGQYIDIEGAVYSDSSDAPDGTILLVQGSSRANGMPFADGAIFIRCREAGAALLIQAKLPQGSRVSTHVVFSGHGDILGKDDIDAEGITVPKAYWNAHLSKEEIDELFTVKEIAAARQTAPKLEAFVADSGEIVKLNVAKAPRRMRIRKA
jgi:hypothetical protein